MWLMFMGHCSDSRFCEVAPMFSFMFVQKAHLELEGHTAVQPSEFFLGDNGSTLIIVLRNEDIVEHICEVMVLLITKLMAKDLQQTLTDLLTFLSQVPNLLMLKKFRGVRFAGIDEPDDVVNLTHQELFVKGGFILFDRAILESLSLRMSFLDFRANFLICVQFLLCCQYVIWSSFVPVEFILFSLHPFSDDMKKMSEIFKGLNRTGKWKWMLHYRDSRRLKENAR